MATVPATFVSVWDGGTAVRTDCKFDEETKRAFDIDTADVDGLDSLDEEYVELGDGTEIRRQDGLLIEGQEEDEDDD